MITKNKIQARIIIILFAICLIFVQTAPVSSAQNEAVKASAKSAMGFTDLKTAHWAYKNIQTLVALGGIKGYADGGFKPEGTITYAELCSILMGATGNNNVISSGNWANGMLEKAYAVKIVDENQVPLGDANKAVSREKMAMILSRSAESLCGEELITLNHISDYVRDWSAIGSAYKEYVNQCVAAGLIVGDSLSNFKPSSNLTRAEAATICLRLIDQSTRETPVKYSPLKLEHPPMDTYEVQVTDLVNQERGAAGLSTLKLNEKLSEVAKIKAEDMRDQNYFAHNSPIYGTPFEMMTRFGVTYRMAGENIAKGYGTPKYVMNGWMNSPGHKQNILNDNFTEIGVGYVTDSNGTAYWVQMFIRP